MNTGEELTARRTDILSSDLTQHDADVRNELKDELVKYFNIHANKVYDKVSARDFICDNIEFVTKQMNQDKSDTSKLSVRMGAELADKIAELHQRISEKPDSKKSPEGLEAQTLLASIAILCDRR